MGAGVVKNPPNFGLVKGLRHQVVGAEVFSAESHSAGASSLFAAITALPQRVPFFMLMAVTILAGARVYLKEGKGSALYAGLSGLAFIGSLTAVLSVFSLYIYELPTHHCPFCLLKPEYHYVGYPLYLTLFGGTVTGMGTGALSPFRKVASLEEILPLVQRRLALVSIVCYTVFTAVIAETIVSSNLKLGGFL